MNKQEFVRLYAYYAANKSRPWKPIIENKGRRHIKGKGKAVGQVLKYSSVSYQTMIER